MQLRPRAKSHSVKAAVWAHSTGRCTEAGDISDGKRSPSQLICTAELFHLESCTPKCLHWPKWGFFFLLLVKNSFSSSVWFQVIAVLKFTEVPSAVTGLPAKSCFLLCDCSKLNDLGCSGKRKSEPHSNLLGLQWLLELGLQIRCYDQIIKPTLNHQCHIS